MRRRAWLGAPLWSALLSAHPSAADPVSSAAQAAQVPWPLQFPRDHGAHLPLRTEWWYATGELSTATGQVLGFQITFFRSRVASLRPETPRRFEPRHLLFAHGALTELAAQRQSHAQRLARWNGDPEARPAYASLDDTGVAIGSWRLVRTPLDRGSRYQAVLDDAGFGFDLQLDTTQPLLLQGDAGYSRKGPEMSQASGYYTQPQLVVTGQVKLGTQRLVVRGRAWLDHEWSESLMHPHAVGWDWIGMNLDDGGALTAFQLRRADGSALWTGGSWRAAGRTQAQNFGADEVRFTPLAYWHSPQSGARYPVRWRVDTPAGRFVVQARMNAQELDSRLSTGTIYWEGLSDLLDGSGVSRKGRGYLEMTGYAGRLRL